MLFRKSHYLIKYVTYPIEVAMNGLPNLEKIRSISNFGLSVVNIYFKDETDIYFARQLVNERIQEAREQIPEGFGKPEMGPISTGMGLILFYYLDDQSGKYSLEELRSIQDWVVKFHLQTVPGVTEVLGIGGYEKQYQVIIDPFSLLQYNITIQDVIEKIKELQSELNLQNLLVWSSMPGVKHEDAMRSIKLFNNEVIPKIKAAKTKFKQAG